MSVPTLIEKLYNAEPEARPAIIAIPDAAARDVIRQLATKPLWDGDLNSKKQDDKPDDREKQDDSEVFTVTAQKHTNCTCPVCCPDLWAAGIKGSRQPAPR